MIPGLQLLQKKSSLNESQMTDALQAIMTGKASDLEIEEFLILLREKGETVTEIAAAAKVMRKHAIKLSRTFPEALDTCGTGGDSSHTLNVSTLSAIVAAASGAQIAKHGNRSVSSVCGSADLLELLGVNIDLEAEKLELCLEETGFGFFFAPRFHPAVKHAMSARKKIQGKTIFNILGPLSNPAGASYQLIGVYEKPLVEKMAQVLLELGAKRALVVHGADGLDEITLSDSTHVAELNAGKIRAYTIKPEDFGLPQAPLTAIQCKSKTECRDEALKVLKGVRGPKMDIVSLNAGAALYTAGCVGSIREGVVLAKEKLMEGEAMIRLERIAEFSNR